MAEVDFGANLRPPLAPAPLRSAESLEWHGDTVFLR